MKAIGMWKMSYQPFKKAKKLNGDDFILKTLSLIEDDEEVHTVGTHSYANSEHFLELDAAFMHGNSIMVGAVMGARHIKNPIKVAHALSENIVNNMLVGNGADHFAKENGFETLDVLPSYESDQEINNHDTCAIITYDNGNLNLGISSSGRANKFEGRVGDSPLIGSGFYCDDDTCAVAFTGDGEMIARGVLAKSVSDEYTRTENIQQALEDVCNRYLKKIYSIGYKDPYFSAIAIDNKGEIGVYTSEITFPYTVLDDNDVKLYVCRSVDGKIQTELASVDFLRNYEGD